MFVIAMLLSYGTVFCFGRVLGSDATTLVRTRCDTVSTVRHTYHCTVPDRKIYPDEQDIDVYVW